MGHLRNPSALRVKYGSGSPIYIVFVHIEFVCIQKEMWGISA